jgi:ketosteroid isomerase-like protein
MAEESTTRDLIALTRAMGAAEDVETTMSFFGPDPVWDGSPLGLETYEGRDAVRESLEDWIEIYEDQEEDDQEILDLGNGVVFTATRLSGHPRSASATDRIHGVYGFVIVRTEGEISHVTVYPDIDEARAVAERLAEKRGR